MAARTVCVLYVCSSFTKVSGTGFVTLLLADVSVDVTSIDFSPFTEPVFLVRRLSVLSVLSVCLSVCLQCLACTIDVQVLVFNVS